MDSRDRNNGGSIEKNRGISISLNKVNELYTNKYNGWGMKCLDEVPFSLLMKFRRTLY